MCGANGPVTPEAEDDLEKKGVTVDTRFSSKRWWRSL